MTPSAPASASAKGGVILPGQVPGAFPADGKLPPQGNDPAKSQFQNGKPSAPGAGARRNPLFDKDRKSDPEAAAKLLKDANTHYEKKNLKKAYELYQKAFAADPKNGQVVLRLANLAFQLQDPLASNEYVSFYIEMNPDDWKKRAVRLKVNDFILRAMQANFDTLKDNEKAQAVNIIQTCLFETLQDKAILMANTTPEQLEALKKQETELEGLHKQPLEAKKLAIFGGFAKFEGGGSQQVPGILASIEELKQMLALPYPDQKTADKVGTELPKLIAETYSILHRFAKADSDPEINKLAPGFEAYSLLAQGKTQEAVKPLETVRSEGYKKLGNGDEAKGREILLAKIEEGKKLVADKKGPEFQKLIAEIPSGLLDAHHYLERIEGDHLVRANLAALEVWSKQIDDKRAAEIEDATDFFGTAGGALFGQPGRLIWAAGSWAFGDNKGYVSYFDEVNERSSKEHDVLHEVRKRIESGKAKTIKEALEDIKAKESGHTKDRAIELLANKDLLGSLISYVSTVKTDPEAEKAVLSGMETLKTMGVNHANASNVSAIIQYHSRDAGVQKKAGESVDKDKLNGEISKLLVTADAGAPAGDDQKQAKK